MTMRRDFLAFATGAVAAGTALPLVTRAKTQPDQYSASENGANPDRDLLVAIEAFKELEWQYLGLYEDGTDTYILDQEERDERVELIRQAQKPLLETICLLRATTLHGMRARVGCILLEDQELDPAETAASGEFQNEHLLAALLRDLMPRRAVA